MMTTRPDVLLIEASMPGMDGYAVCCWVRNHPAMAHVPVVILSGEPDAEREYHARHSGVDATLSKPVNPSAISQQVRAVLQRRPPSLPAP
jgi:DNA-binding response OmpR family regulator